MKQHFFKEDTYKTPKETSRIFWDKLTLNSNIHFMVRFMTYIMQSRSIALKGKFSTEMWAENSYKIFKLVEECGGRYNMSGLSNISKNEAPTVFVGNHMSTLETMILPGIIANVKEVVFVVKDSLVKHPWFGPVIRARAPIVVGRKDSRADLKLVMQQGLAAIKEGKSVVIFPQSTRMQQFIPEQFNSLGVKLAAKAGVSVTPLALKTDFWGPGKLFKDLGPIYREREIFLSFGEAMDVDGNGKTTHQATVNFIQTCLANWSK